MVCMLVYGEMTVISQWCAVYQTPNQNGVRVAHNKLATISEMLKYSFQSINIDLECEAKQVKGGATSLG